MASGRRILYPQDIANFCGCSKSTAYRKYDIIRSAYQLPSGNSVTVYHFAKFMKITVAEVVNAVLDIPLVEEV